MASARRASVLGYDEYLQCWSQLHGGYDPSSGMWLVRTWLDLVYRCARPMAAAGASPGAVTVAGVLATALALAPAAAGGRWPLLAAGIVVASGLLDNLDGALAVLTRRTSAWGYVLDSVADRVSDMAYLVALWLLGAPGWLVVAAGTATWLLEYTRARAGNAGFGEIGAVTVGERPTRVIAAAAGLAGAGAIPAMAAASATIGAAVTLGTGVVGIVQLAFVLRPVLLRGVDP